MKKNIIFLTGILLLSPALFALSAEEVFEAALERAGVKAVAQAQEQVQEDEYKGFNPHLSDKELAQIRSSLYAIQRRLNSWGYSFTLDDIVEGLLMYSECSCGVALASEEVAGYEYVNGRLREKVVRVTLSEKGLLRKHAIRYAFEKLLAPYAPGAIKYNPADFPKVKDWKAFHFLCQDEMIYIHVLLQEAKAGTDEHLASIFCNIL